MHLFETRLTRFGLAIGASLVLLYLTTVSGSSESDTYINVQDHIGPLKYAYTKKTSPFNYTHAKAKQSYNGYIEHTGLNIRATGKVSNIVEYQRCSASEESILDCNPLYKLEYDGETIEQHQSVDNYVKVLKHKTSYRHHFPFGQKGPNHKFEMKTWPYNANHESIPRTLHEFMGPPEKPLYSVWADYFEANSIEPYQFSCKGRVYQQGSPIIDVGKRNLNESHFDYLLDFWTNEFSGNLSLAVNSTCHFSSFAEPIVDSVKITLKTAKLENCPRWDVKFTIETQPMTDIFNSHIHIRENCDMGDHRYKTNTSVSINASSIAMPYLNTRLEQTFVHDDLQTYLDSMSMTNTLYSMFVDSDFTEEKFYKTIKLVQNMMPNELAAILEMLRGGVKAVENPVESKEKELLELRYSNDPAKDYIDATMKLSRDGLSSFGILNSLDEKSEGARKNHTDHNSHEEL